MKAVRFTVIGAGGIFTCGLVVHLAREAERLRSEMGRTSLRLVLMDVDPDRLDRTAQLGRRAIEEAGLRDRISIEPVMNENRALDGTDLVLFIRSFQNEEARNIEIATKHGVAGGHDGPACLGLARLCFHAAERIARKVLRLGTKGARMIVFCNPTDVLAQATQLKTGLETWGWCGAPDSLREGMADQLGVEPGRVTRLRSVGVNHFSYVTELDVDGKPAIQLLKRRCARGIPKASSEKLRVWMEWVRDTGWPYLTIGHPAPWNEPIVTARLWTNPEAPAMYKAVDAQLAGKKIDLDHLVRVFGWEGTTGLAMTRLVCALFGNGSMELGWQCRHEGAVRGLPADVWLEHTMQVRKGKVREADFRPLPEPLEAQVRLLAIQNREMARAVAEDDSELAVRSLAVNPFSCSHSAAKAYVNELWATSR